MEASAIFAQLSREKLSETELLLIGNLNYDELRTLSLNVGHIVREIRRHRESAFLQKLATLGNV